MKAVFELSKADWERSRQENINLILMSTMQIKMAKRVLLMVEEELAKFPADKVEAPVLAKPTE